jgi:hypothetical protein
MKKLLGIMVLGLALGGCDGDAASTQGGHDTTDVADSGGSTDTSDTTTADTASDTTTDTAPLDTTLDASPDPDTGPLPDDATTDAADTAPLDAADGQDAAAPDAVEPDGAAPSEFTIRVPQEHTLTCEGWGGTEEMDVMDTDHVCTFEWQGTSAEIYVQATPVGCNTQGFPYPVFEVQGAFMKKDGVVTTLSGTTYDFGGNHNNDALKLLTLGKKFKYFHSSFGWGFRKCQPMDCLQVFEPGGALVEDGCTMERTLPVVCVKVGEDGTVPPLVDAFEPCDGDPNYP